MKAREPDEETARNFNKEQWVMKAMWAALAAIVIIGAVAAVALNSFDFTTAEKYSTPSTRLE